MSRSGLSEDCDEQWMYALYRGRVASATRGKRGQRFYRELLAALDAMPVKELHRKVFDEQDGRVCALGALAQVKGIDVTKFDPEDSEAAEVLAAKFDVADCLTREVIWHNDEFEHVRAIPLYGGQKQPDWAWGHGATEYAYVEDPPDVRWQNMRDWVAKQIKEPTP